MHKDELLNTQLIAQERLITPHDLRQSIAISKTARAMVINSRRTIENILDRKDDRIFVIMGPCSIHDPVAAIDYATRFKHLAKAVERHIYLVMRVYFEKPRTTVGWKGLINDPDLDGSFNITKGYRIARKLLLDIAEMGIAAATEALDPVTPQYIGDLISWTAIGARTAESQTHREMSSGLSTSVGFKNSTDGNLETCINAMQSASMPHSFLGINDIGQMSITHSAGNPYAHIVLRGGRSGPNYDSVNVALTEQKLAKANLPANIVIDCSHANSNKNPMLQPLVMENCIHQITEGNRSIVGLMIESHLNAGQQKITDAQKDLAYGVSITDACVSWETTENMLLSAYQQLDRHKKR